MLRNPGIRLEILGLIHKNPGITIKDISGTLDVPKTTCMFHLNNLKEKQQIKINGYGKKRYFLEDTSQNEIRLITPLRILTTKEIVLNLIKNDMQTFHDLCENINKSKSTISIYLKKLIDEEIVQLKIKNKEKIFSLKDKGKLEELIKKYNF